MGQNAPVLFTDQINNKAVLRFTRIGAASGSVLVTNIDIRPVTTPDITVFTVYKQGTRSGDQAPWGSDNGNWDRFFISSLGGAVNGVAPFGPAPPYYVSVVDAATVGQTRLLTAVYDGDITESDGMYENSGPVNSSAIYFNGSLITSFTDKTHPTDEKPNFYIGWDGDNSAFNGDIAEIILYNRKLTKCEILAVNNYLADKYGEDFNSFKVSVSSGSAILNEGESVTLSASSGTSYKWFKNGTEIPLATNSSYTTSEPGDYSARITNGDGCSITTKPISVAINYPPTDISLSQLTIDENSSIETTIGTFSSTDLNTTDTFTYSFVTGTGDGDNTSFTISSNSLLVNGAFNFEAKSSYSIRVRTTDSRGLTFEKVFTITVNDVNEKPVVTANQSFNINENSANNTTVGTVQATDPDAGATLSNWMIKSGNYDNAFVIDSSTGMLTVNDQSALNYEPMPTYELEITVSDGSLTSVSQVVIVNVLDVNEAPMVIDEGSFYVYENSPAGTEAGNAYGHDPDDDNVLGNWNIVSGNENNTFVIDPQSGLVTVNNPTLLDFESRTQMTMEITVSDGSLTSLPHTIYIYIKDVNEHPEVTPSQVFNVNENAVNETVVGTVVGTDPDEDAILGNWTIVSGNNSDAFSLNAETGKLTVHNTGALDYEVNSSFTLVITVSDGDLTSTTETVVINLNNLNDNPPVVLTDLVYYVDENSEEGTEVGVLEATDADSPTTFSNWTIVSGNTDDAFLVDPATGVITVNNFVAMDYEVNSTFSLVVTVMDGIHTSIAQSVTVHLNDLFENFDGNPVIYTAFSPNGDNVNDIWNIPGLAKFPECEVKIFNSDGIELFYNKGYTKQWDGKHNGKDMPLGTYFYLIKLNNDSKTIYKGHLMIIK